MPHTWGCAAVKSFSQNAARGARPIMQRITNPLILSAFALILVSGWGIATANLLWNFDLGLDSGGRPLGGDFMAFYAAGHMVGSGEAGSLYDLAAQQRMQQRILGPRTYSGLAAYVNPPLPALLFTPLAALPYRAAFITCSLLTIACAALAGFRAARIASWSERMTTVGLTVTFFPIIIAATGGQNTPVSLLLLTLAYGALLRNSDRAAGAWLGLLAFKPQMIALLLLLALLRRRWWCVGVAAAVIAAQGAVSGVILGFDWPLRYLAMLRDYAPLEAAANEGKSISLVALAGVSLGTATTTALWVASAIAVLSTWIGMQWPPFVCAARSRWRLGQRDSTTCAVDASDRATITGADWSAAICASLLLSPHAMWYETGLLTLPAVLLIDEHRRRGREISGLASGMLVMGFLAAPVYAFGPQWGWQPLILWPLCMLIWALRVAGADARTASQTGYSGLSAMTANGGSESSIECG
ncbi:MAG: glycosyltransferase family 87 protein [Phycisphaerae bacterium]